MNAQEITKLMAVLGTEYPRNFEVTPERIKLWESILHHADYAEASNALAQLLSEARPFPPVVGELNQKIIDNRQVKEKSLQRQRAIQASLPAPQLTPEEIERNKAFLRKLSQDLATKKAMRQ